MGLSNMCFHRVPITFPPLDIPQKVICVHSLAPTRALPFPFHFFVYVSVCSFNSSQKNFFRHATVLNSIIKLPFICYYFVKWERERERNVIDKIFLFCLFCSVSDAERDLILIWMQKRATSILCCAHATTQNLCKQ